MTPHHTAESEIMRHCCRFEDENGPSRVKLLWNIRGTGDFRSVRYDEDGSLDLLSGKGGLPLQFVLQLLHLFSTKICGSATKLMIRKCSNSEQRTMSTSWQLNLEVV